MIDLNGHASRAVRRRRAELLRGLRAAGGAIAELMDVRPESVNAVSQMLDGWSLAVQANSKQ